MIKHGQRRGRDTIIVDEWGPYDWKSPKLWPAGKPDDRPLKLRVLGADGHVDGSQRVTRRNRVTAERRVPGEICASPQRRPVHRLQRRTRVSRRDVTSPRGLRTPAGSAYRFRLLAVLRAGRLDVFASTNTPRRRSGEAAADVCDASGGAGAEDDVRPTVSTTFRAVRSRTAFRRIVLRSLRRAQQQFRLETISCASSPMMGRGCG